MKPLSAENIRQIPVDEETLKKQIKVGQTISRINTVMDMSEGLKDWEGVRRIEIYLRLEEKLLGNEEEIGLIDEL
jgi:hypothetical protein